MPSLIEISAAAQEARVRLTPQARALTKVVLEAITEDPHRGWLTRTGGQEYPSAEVLLAQQQALVRDLPNLFTQIKEERTVVDGNVSTFDVLHWLSRNLDNYCPFDK
jgi:hypothetical protein